MEKQLFGTIKNYINSIRDEYKVYKKIGNSYRMKRIVSIISEYGKDTQLYTFMMSSLSNIDFDKVEYSYKGVTIIDDKNNKSLKIMLLPNIKNVENICIEFIDDEVISRKEFSFLYGEINVKEFKEKDKIKIKTHRKYIDNEMVYEDVTRVKTIDKDNYYLVSNTSHVDENNAVIMKEFVQLYKDGLIDSQFFKYYRGHLLDDAKYHSRSGYNIDYLYNYLEDNKYKISYDEYNAYRDRIEHKQPEILVYRPKKND